MGVVAVRGLVIGLTNPFRAPPERAAMTARPIEVAQWTFIWDFDLSLLDGANTDFWIYGDVHARPRTRVHVHAPARPHPPTYPRTHATTYPHMTVEPPGGWVVCVCVCAWTAREFNVASFSVSEY